MLKEFNTHLCTNFPFLLEKPFLIACSGGLDSVVLTHLCFQNKLKFALAHCNFRLRGEQSDADEAFVKQLSENLEVPFHITHFDTLGYVNDKKVSIQMAARTLRYTWFQRILEQHGYSKVLTAHHLDDTLETFLINLSRGTGIKGLSGIPENTSYISRPLLPFSRAHLESYAAKNSLVWREDASNQDAKYLRNKLRLEVIPILKKVHPSFLDNFQRSLSHLAQTADIAESHIAVIKKQLFFYEDGIYKIIIDELKKLEPLEGYLFALFKEYGFVDSQAIIALFDAMSGKELKSATHRLLKDRSALYLMQISNEKGSAESYIIDEYLKEIKHPIHLEFSELNNVHKDNSTKVIYIDKEKLKFPLMLRKWKSGDVFYPLGFNRKKKLSKYFKDEKVPVLLKEKQWLLCSNNAIVWVVGMRADERFKVTAQTKEILRITVGV